jgi:uncharacterized phage-associated protein
MTVRVRDAAKYLCALSGWRLSNLPLQKILYLADMNFVGKGAGRLVDEDFEAWDYGPVAPSLYRDCKAFGSKPIPDIFWGAGNIAGSPEAAMLEAAWKALGHQQPGKLIEQTHWSGGAWAKRYAPGAKGIKIELGDMADEYRNRVASLQPAS